MKGQKLFREYYEPKLIEQGIDNVVLRTYTHIKGFATDDPDNSTQLLFTPRAEVDERMDVLFAGMGESRGMAITSLVSVKATPKYLFLLDCSLAISEEHERGLINTLRSSTHLFPALRSGMVLRTRNSYHVIGFVPLTLHEWNTHMGQAILLRTAQKEVVADIRYVGHSLERGYGSLRLSDYQGKPTPDFVTYL